MTGVRVFPQLFEQVRESSGRTVVEVMVRIDDPAVWIDDVFLDLGRPIDVDDIGPRLRALGVASSDFQIPINFRRIRRVPKS